MTKQEYLKTQRQLREAKWEAYDSKDYAQADAIQAELDALIDPEPDEILTEDDDLMALLSKDEIGTYEDVEQKHRWMRNTY